MLIIGESHLVPCLFSGLPWIPASFRLLSLLLKMGVGGDIQRSQLQRCSPCAANAAQSHDKRQSLLQIY